MARCFEYSDGMVGQVTIFIKEFLDAHSKHESYLRGAQGRELNSVF